MDRWFQIQRLCEGVRHAITKGEFPDILAIASQNEELGPDLLRQLLVIEFDCRWEHGHGQPVEIVLRKYPQFLGDEDLLLQLAASELRWMVAEPDVIEYRERFPSIGSALEELFAVRALLAQGDFNDWLGHSLQYSLTPSKDLPVLPDLASSSEEGHESHSLTDLFRLIRRLGTGGSKDVFEAEQASTRQHVAVKLPKAETSSEENRQSFLREARTQARLNHQNIPAIFGLGLDSNTPGLIIEQLVSGQPWSHTLSSLSFDENFRILREVCNAAAFAHRRHSLIHRDIKPANVMINDEFGEVYLLDWGLALNVGQAQEHDRETLHVSGASGICGTPEYMAPEMALNRPETCTTATDVFLLGGILYHILTGVPPNYPSGNRQPRAMEMLCQAAMGNTIPPRQRAPNRNISPEIETIVMKAMAFDQQDRFRDAGEFAAALDEFTQHAEADRLRQEADSRLAATQHRRQEIVKNGESAALLSTELISIADEYHRAARLIETAQRSSENPLPSLITSGQQLAIIGERTARLELIDLAIALGDFGLAHAQLELATTYGATDQLESAKTRLRNAQRRRQRERTIRRGSIAAFLVAAGLTATASWLLLQARTREAEQRLSSANERIQSQIALESERRAKQVAVQSNREAIRHQFETQTIAEPGFHSAAVASLAQAYKNSDWFVRRPALLESEQLALVSVQSSSRRILSRRVLYDQPHGLLIADDVFGHLHAFRLNDGVQIAAFSSRHQVDPENRLYALEDMTLVPGDMTRIATAGPDGSVRIWNVTTQQMEMTFAPIKDDAARRWTAIAAQPMKSKSIHLLVGEENGHVAWLESHGEHLKLRQSTKGHQNQVGAVAWRFDGKQCATGSSDGTIIFWDNDGRRQAELSIADDATESSMSRINRVSYSPNGLHLAAACRDGKLYLIDAQRFAVIHSMSDHEPVKNDSAVTCVAWISDEQVVSGGADGRIRIWDATNGEMIRTLGQHDKDILGVSMVSCLAAASDGSELASAGVDGALTRWYLPEGKTGMRLEGTQEMGLSQSQAVAADFDLETNQLLICGMGRHSFLHLFDVPSGRETGTFREGSLAESPSNNVAPSVVCLEPGGKRFAVAESSGEFTVWDIPSRSIVKRIKDETVATDNLVSATMALAWSRDQKRLASLSRDGRVRIWEATDFESITDSILQSEATIPLIPYGLLFGPTSNELLIFGADELIRVWDCKTSQWQTPFKGHLNPVTAVAFKPELDLVISGDVAGSVIVWNYSQRSILAHHKVEKIRLPFSPYLALSTAKDTTPYKDSRDVRLESNDAGILEAISNPRITVQSVAISPDARLLGLSLNDGTVRLLHSKSGATLSVGAAHEFGLPSMSWHAVFFDNSGSLRSVGSDGTLRRWELLPWMNATKVVSLSSSVRKLHTAKATGRIAAVDYSKNLLLRSANSQAFETIDLGSVKIGAAAFLPDGNRLALGSVDGDLLIYDCSKNLIEKKLSTNLHQAEHPSRGTEDAMTVLAVRPDGMEIASNARADGTILIWNLSNDSVKPLTPNVSMTRRYYAIAYHPWQTELAAVGFDGFIDRWDASHNYLDRLPVRGPGTEALSNGLVYSPDGKLLVQTGFGKEILFWDTVSKKVHQRMSAHREDSSNIAWSNSPVFVNDGNRMVTCGGDGMLRIWQRGVEDRFDAVAVISTLTLQSHQETDNITAASMSQLPDPQAYELYSVVFDSMKNELIVAGYAPEIRVFSLDAIMKELDRTATEWGSDLIDRVGLDLFVDKLIPRRVNRMVSPTTVENSPAQELRSIE